MAQYLYEGGTDIKSSQSLVVVNLLLIHFQDEHNVHIIYSPHLDLSGYGDTLETAKTSFGVALEDFVEYTVNKKTLGKVLSELGWKLKGEHRKPGTVIAPGIKSVIRDNNYVSEIFDKYPVNTYHQEIGVPGCV